LSSFADFQYFKNSKLFYGKIFQLL